MLGDKFSFSSSSFNSWISSLNSSRVISPLSILSLAHSPINSSAVFNNNFAITKPAIKNANEIKTCLFKVLFWSSNSSSKSSILCNLAIKLYLIDVTKPPKSLAGGVPIAVGIGKLSKVNLVFNKAWDSARNIVANPVLMITAVKSWLICLTALFLFLIASFNWSGLGHLAWFFSVILEIPNANNILINKGISLVVKRFVTFWTLFFLATIIFSTPLKNNWLAAKPAKYITLLTSSLAFSADTSILNSPLVEISLFTWSFKVIKEVVLGKYPCLENINP